MRKPLIRMKTLNALKNVSAGISSQTLVFTNQNVPSIHPI
ncbi:hypothetical protein C427_2288 [Paraglaciecola psychrophila 170]|uniref:Uncharacterized protein n=1 Tax=Paraglaciecola psychrophila 170 TaxID=1129794 RepID=K7ARR4_9ALTE|nr:hypothetical protein C427_2288 [Paraglaciecola psychrophila 170]GAC37955.1 hypothetical protein GPSY_2334 [Paraglaciecola psychrophila 170]